MENFDIIELQDRVFEYLNELSKQDEEFLFILRKDNYGGRLSDGYWFYGDDENLYLSFWSGVDWKSRVPNISIRISVFGELVLEVSVNESDFKRKFINEHLYDLLKLNVDGKKYSKKITESSSSIESILRSIDAFINSANSDKFKIDSVLRKFSLEYFRNFKNDDAIFFIDKNEFSMRQEKVHSYRNNFSYEDSIINPVISITDIQIQNYGIIKSFNLKDIQDRQWIFITGENGSGKTSLLRAIITLIGDRKILQGEIIGNEGFFGRFSYAISNDHFTYDRYLNHKSNCPRLSFAGYGPYRLDVSKSKLSKRKFKEAIRRGKFKSLFENAIPLLSIDNQFDIWRSDKKLRDNYEQRKDLIKNVFVQLVPTLHNIFFDEVEGNRKRVTRYVIKNNDSDNEHFVLWKELSSGTRSVFGLVGDIMIRLYAEQEDVIDPSDLIGTVIIDEIDLHLHPKAQKDLVVNLKNVFPAVKFIVTTHSPIPLLGAPENSIFLKTERGVDQVVFQRLDGKIPVMKLLPNALLASPLFDLDDFAPVDKTISELLTSDNYEEALYSYLLRKRFDQSYKK